jgi:putative membrane protein
VDGEGISHNIVETVLDSVATWLPAANAALIVISGICLAFGYLFIRTRRIAWHRRSMIAASFFAAAFLVVYVTRWALLGSKGYDGESRVLYFSVLISHTLIAIAVAPLAFVTLRRARAGRFKKHRQIARVTLPMWIYTAVTGWLVYAMLYSRLFS